jgi:hypothetical protein
LEICADRLAKRIQPLLQRVELLRKHQRTLIRLLGFVAFSQ